MSTVYTDNSIAAPAIFINSGTTASPVLTPVQTTGWNLVSTTATLTSNKKYTCDTTSAAFTVTLPSAPANQDWIEISDAQQFWATNNLTVNPNGKKINASTSNLVLSSPVRLVLIYNAGVQGWSKF